MLSMKKFAKCSARDQHQRVRPGGAHRLAEAVELGMERVLHGRVGEMGAAGDARGVAADAGEDQAHTPATFSSSVVVIA